MKMKNKLLAMLAAPMAFATGCSDDEIAQVIKLLYEPFDSEIHLYKDVVGEVKETEATRYYLAYDGEIFEVDDLAPTANTDTETHCLAIAPDVESESTSEYTNYWGKQVRRYVGQQTAWLVREPSFTDDNENDNAPIEANSSVDDSDLWLIKPEFTTNDWDIFFNDNEGNYNNFLSNTSDLEDYRQYWWDLLVEEIQLFYYEDAMYYHYINKETVVTKFNDTVTTVVNTDEPEYGAEKIRELRTSLDGYFWRLGMYDIFETEEVQDSNISGYIIVPDGVQVGDAWIADSNGFFESSDSFSVAVTTQLLSLANGVTIEAMVIVQRGEKEFDVASSGVMETCVDFFNASSEATQNGVTTAIDNVDLDVTILDLCNGDEGGNLEMDFVNEHTFWYFGGIVVKEHSMDTRVAVHEAGYAKLDLDNGNCDKMYIIDGGSSSGLPIFGVPVTQTNEYKPYIRFSVSDVERFFEATEIRDTNVLLEEFNNTFGEPATDVADSEEEEEEETEE